MESWSLRMVRPREWSDVVVQGIADCFQLCILVWHAALPQQRTFLVHSQLEPVLRQYVYLMFHERRGCEHYNALVAKKSRNRVQVHHPSPLLLKLLRLVVE